MSEEHPFESDVSASRRTFVKRSAVASLGVGLGVRARNDGGETDREGLGVGAQEESGIQYYQVVVPNRGIVRGDYLNKFLFTTAFRERITNLPFSDCFEKAETQARQAFEKGAYVYDGVLVDATEAFQLFGGDDDAIQRLRSVLESQDLDLPDTLTGSIGAIVGTRIYAPVSGGRLPTTGGYRAVGGESCDGQYARLRVHELPNEVIE
ncbi:hypothetical protein M0R89_16590 [Halorussus limi]|uniref:Twin-arginine translocation signal domain-containing protein n=1 Tax=Halorussus limi TaxID=2938695 RepID=A0A8U0HU11_9EURY|nr:hypothetical protein [Halorussus limi]UPV74144.1 hypothetical protein M0R89_16590 [Halorussus limi]